ncbi:hypothetical protein Tco_0674693 [Tanacetum coccineum]
MKLPLPKTSPLEDDDLVEEEAIEVNKTKSLVNDLEDKSLENNEIINIKESKSYPLDNVIGNLNQRTLRSQAQDKSNFFCFLSTIEPKNINEALSWVMAMQEELNQFKSKDVWELVLSQAVNKSPTHYPCDSARTFRVILFSIHNDEWKSFQCHHQTALRIHKDGDGDASLQLKSNSLPHAHAHSTKTFYKHQDSMNQESSTIKDKDFHKL